jgi:hypothetical protein
MQVSVEVSQKGAALGQATLLVALQTTQVPAWVPEVSQIGRAPLQSVAVQPRQVPVVASQKGILPEHWAVSLQATHRPSRGSPGVLLQWAVAPTQPTPSSLGLHRRHAGALELVQIGTLGLLRMQLFRVFDHSF